MKKLKFIVILLCTYISIYFLIAFIKWDYNLLDEITEYSEARLFVLILLAMGFILAIKLFELTE